MIRLKLPPAEELDRRLSLSELETRQNETVTRVATKHAFRLEPSRAGTGEEIACDAAADDVVELELEDGIRLWVRVDELPNWVSGAAERGAPLPAAGEIILPTTLPFGTPSRGIGSWLLKGVRLLDVQLEEIAADKIAEKIENGLLKSPGLYRLSTETPPPNPDPKWHPLGPTVKTSEIPTDRPLLVFIHGTASNTLGSFGGLWEPLQSDAHTALVHEYGGHWYGFEHRTLSVSPIENALELARLLPAGATVHLVSHSRGGLVGELLCRGDMADRRQPFTPEDLEAYARRSEKARDALDRDDESKRAIADAYTAQGSALAELNRLLKEKGFRVERFVRVACPTKGTTLASGRLDAYLSVIMNVLGHVPGLKGNPFLEPVYEFTSDLLLAVVKQRLHPERLPGIEAMIPTSPLIGLLNTTQGQSAADLSVIAGDAQGEGLLGRLAILATDLFYMADHDLVVNTLAMFGGTERQSRLRYFFDRGPTVNHFNYFRNTKTVDRLVAALTESKREDDGFTLVEAPLARLQERFYRGIQEAPPVVFVLPGIMGSHLAIGDNRIWIEPFNLASGGLRRIESSARNVRAEALVGLAYSNVLDFLQDSHQVVPFPFDWRRSVREEGRRLAAAVRARLQGLSNNQPVRFLAHSMGGLVVRAMIAEDSDLWGELKAEHDTRVVMLGTPNQGSYVIPRLLLGQERLLKQMALVDLKNSEEQLRQLVSHFPGLLELLPASENGAWDFFDRETWLGLLGATDGDWGVLDQALLDRAKETRSGLGDDTLEPDHMVYVAGAAPATPMALEVEGDDRRFMATPRGDGRVPWATGIPASLQAWFVPTTHGHLADHKPSFQGLLDLLVFGETDALAREPITAARGVAERSPLPLRDDVPTFPDEAALSAAALGAEPSFVAETPTLPVKVWVSHGDFSYGTYPVAVGHYFGDTIISAENTLDNLLAGRLRARHQLGLYPGLEGTAEVFLNPDREPAGALIVGLGQVGKLNPRSLATSFAKAVLKYSMALLEDTRTQPGSTATPHGLTALLIGTSAGGMSIKDSTRALLLGVLEANRELEAAKLADRVSIDELEIIELYEHTAIQAAHCLVDHQKDPDFAGKISVEPQLRLVQGRQRRERFAEQPGWWRRLQILSDRKEGSLKFNALTDKARTEVSLLSTQRALVDSFIDRAIRSPSSDGNLGHTLFELLIPNRLKEYAPEQQPLVLVLNEDAARYPWELLQERPGPDEEPLAVRSGMLRQLETVTFRERVVSTPERSALVVGVPKAAGFPDILGAQGEAQAVADELKGHAFTVPGPFIDRAPQAVIQALYERGYRLLHLAGHGVFEHDMTETYIDDRTQEPATRTRRVTGMVLGENIFLTPVEIEQMRQVPELVFINCCHLGHLGQPEAPTDRHRLAANLATQLIRMGVRAVVAAGWAVDDRAAETFALSFYRAMLSGQTFGEAVVSARRGTFRNHPTVDTWGAYQCYGDPDYRFTQPIRRPSSAAAQKLFVAPVEVVAELDSLYGAIETADASARKGLLSRAEELALRIPAAWRSDGAVLAALGRVYGELGQEHFQTATGYYKQALEAEDGEVPIKTIEQYANLLVRSAPPGAAQITQGIELLDSLLAIGETAERWSLKGAAYKRLAAAAGRAPDRRKALLHMVASYRKAHELTYQRTGILDPYPLANWLTAEALTVPLGFSSDNGPLQTWLPQLREVLSRQERLQPDFWSATALADYLVVEHLSVGDLDEQVERIISAYEVGIRRGGSPRQIASVVDQQSFLATMLQSGRRGGDTQKLITALEVIRERLAQFDG